MTLSQASDSEILLKLKEIVLTNIEDENFGVDELVSQSGVGLNILRHRIKMLTHKTIHQYIHEIRLNKAAELLRGNSMTVSEVAWKTGFGSPEYFIRCYHDFYGHSPGEAKRRIEKEEEVNQSVVGSQGKRPFPEKPRMAQLLKTERRRLFYGLAGTFVFVFIGILIYLVFSGYPPGRLKNQKNSIAVLPFINDSPETLNDYFINGITDMISIHLSNISDVNIVPRSSTELFRGKSINPTHKIAQDLSARFLVEGSAQKSGDSVMVSIHLIDAHKNLQLWAKNYVRKYEKFFIVYGEIAQEVASVVQAKITPEENY